ncbi:MAG: hypothetical protein N3A71_01905 [Candidatus Dojkabacteria bacterium]|nr:hypothetical protein [Candidatus Dojkabacteria bacterium]
MDNTLNNSNNISDNTDRNIISNSEANQPQQNNQLNPQNNIPVTNVKKNKNIFLIASVVLTIIIVIVLILGIVGLAIISANRGKANELAFYNQFIETEKIPVINNLGKTHEEIVRDALTFKELDSELLRKARNVQKFEGSLIANTNFGIKYVINYEAEEIRGSNSFKTRVIYNLSDQLAKSESALGGKLSYGAVNLDFDSNPVKLTNIYNIKDTNAATYFKLYIPDEVKEFFDIEESLGMFEKYLNTFIKIDPKEIEEYYKSLLDDEYQEQPLFENEDWYGEFASILLREFNNKVTSNVADYAQIEYLGRENVNGLSNLKYRLKIDNQKLANYIADYINSIPEILIQTRSLHSTKKDCENEIGLLCNEEAINQLRENAKENADEIRKTITDIAKGIEFDVYMYVLPSINMITKMDITVNVNDEGRKYINDLSEVGNEVKELSFNISLDYEIKIEKEEILVPSNAISIVDIIKEIIAEFQDLFNQTTNTTDDDLFYIDPVENDNNEYEWMYE